MSLSIRKRRTARRCRQRVRIDIQRLMTQILRRLHNHLESNKTNEWILLGKNSFWNVASNYRRMFWFLRFDFKLVLFYLFTGQQWHDRKRRTAWIPQRSPGTCEKGKVLTNPFKIMCVSLISYYAIRFRYARRLGEGKKSSSNWKYIFNELCSEGWMVE